MMRKLIVTVFLMSLYCFNTFSQQTRIKLVSSTLEETVFKVNVSGFDWNTIETLDGSAKVITLENGVPMLKEGFPSLPKLAASVLIPDNVCMKVSSVVLSYTDFEDMEVAAYNSIKYDPVYNSNDFFPAINAELLNPFHFDGQKGQTAMIYPLQYNPTTKTLRLCNELLITISIDTAAFFNFEDEVTTGINTGNISDLVVFPNPTSGVFNIQYKLENNSNAGMEIYNSMGQSVYSRSLGIVGTGVHYGTFDISGLSTGIYSLALNTGTGSIMKRIVVD